MKSFLLAFQFLTTFPVVRNHEFEIADFPKSLFWFPLVGFVIGASQWGVARILLAVSLPIEFSAILVLIIGLLCTGGLHLDGVADTVDGFAAGRDKDSILRIMKDTRLGVFAVAGIFVVLYLKVQVIQILMKSNQLNAFLMAAIVSRTMMVFCCTWLPYARSEGTGHPFASASIGRHFIPAAVTSVLLVFFVSGLRGLLIGGSALIFTIAFGIYCQRKIGGFTGDTLGFLNESIEVLCLIAATQFVQPDRSLQLWLNL